MAWTADREALAWAAGFFDGEGSTYLDPRPRLQVVQNDDEVLLRFAAAIGGLGKLGGGTKVYGRAKKPIYTHRVTGWRDVQAVVAMLWPFLSTQKREQAVRVLTEDLRRREALGTGGRARVMRYSPDSPRCGSPHPDLRVRDCTACRTAQSREWRREFAAAGGQ